MLGMVERDQRRKHEQEDGPMISNVFSVTLL